MWPSKPASLTSRLLNMPTTLHHVQTSHSYMIRQHPRHTQDTKHVHYTHMTLQTFLCSSFWHIVLCQCVAWPQVLCHPHGAKPTTEHSLWYRSPQSAAIPLALFPQMPHAAKSGNDNLHMLPLGQDVLRWLQFILTIKIMRQRVKTEGWCPQQDKLFQLPLEGLHSSLCTHIYFSSNFTKG